MVRRPAYRSRNAIALSSARQPPAGIVTFLFTDIEGSTQLWQQYPDQMQAALARHHALLRQAVESHGGYVFQIIGDALCAAFSNAAQGLTASVVAQRAMREATWGDMGMPRVRMALHTGTSELHTGDYVAGEYASGLTLSRVTRLLSASHGSQILISRATYELVSAHLPQDVTLRDMGERRLKDLIRPEHIYQIIASDLPQDFPPLKTLDSRPNNLPAPVTSFVGREREIKEVKNLFAATHLLTLMGTGGSGKSRLSLHVAADLIDDFDNGVWFIELAPITNPTLVPQVVASVLGVHEESKQPLMDTLTHYLRDKCVLLVLDNCEHLIDACARLVDTLLRAAPHLKILASSREALRIVGESTFHVPALSIPDAKPLPPIAALAQFEAVRLFIDRAVAVSPGFMLTDTNATAIAQICRQLDGIPLAIELAAARAKAMTVHQIAERLNDRFRLLTGGSRAAQPRQQTLRALIDWSHDLLTEQEKLLWQRLAVFVGGWTLPSAEAICASDPIDRFEIIDLLTNLVDKSLVNADQSNESTRYSMLETIREYGIEKLCASGEDTIVRKRHADYFLRLAEEAEPKLQVLIQKEWQVRLETEHDNLRSAFTYYLDAEPAVALRLADRMGYLWQVRGYATEGRVTIDRALQAAHPPPKELLAKALFWKGIFASRQGDYENAKKPLEESLALSRDLGDKRGCASALTSLGIIAWAQGENALAEKMYRESLALFHELGDDQRVAKVLSNLGNLTLSQGNYAASQRYSEESVAVSRKLGDKLGLAYALNNLGVIMEIHGDLAGAHRAYEESVAISKEHGEKMAFGYSLNGLAHVMLLQNDLAAARRYYLESLTAMQQVGDKRGIAYCLEGFAKVAVKSSRAECALRLIAAAQVLRQAIGSPLNQAERAESDADIAAARGLLDSAVFETASAEGSAMTMEQAIEEALGHCYAA